MMTHAPPHNDTSRSTKRRRNAIALGIASACVAAAMAWWSFAHLPDVLQGDDLTEKDLSRARQIALMNSYSPLAIPASASDIKIEYQRFQDWNFKAAFTLPPRDFKIWTARLKPQGQVAGGAKPRFYKGKTIGVWTGTVMAEPSGRRVTITHSSS